MKKIVILIMILTLLMMGCSNNAENNTPANDLGGVDISEPESTVTLDEFKGLLETAVIVDTRQNDSFLGWDLDGKAGHIKGAVDFSAQWVTADQELLLETFENKGMTPEKPVVLYDTNIEQANIVRSFLLINGFEDVKVFDLNQWDGDLVQYENYHLIVPAQVVEQIVNGQTPQTFESSDVKIVEASWGEASNSYDKGHIPTAFHINTDSIEPPTTTEPVMWMLADDDVLEAFALAHGFTANDTVIVTGEEQMAAYRVALVLRYLGVKDVRVLNGGTLAWENAGYPLDTNTYEPVPVESFGAEIPGRPELVETIEELKVSLKDDKFTLVDNRTWEEHIGESTGYSYHDKAGRIPGSVFGYAGFGNAYSMSFFRNPDNTMRRPEEFVALWEEQGIDITNRLAFMCGSGWRAAEILFYADVFGIDDITLYSDGWIGWSNNDNPFETGDDSN